MKNSKEQKRSLEIEILTSLQAPAKMKKNKHIYRVYEIVIKHNNRMITRSRKQRRYLTMMTVIRKKINKMSRTKILNNQMKK